MDVKSKTRVPQISELLSLWFPFDFPLVPPPRQDELQKSKIPPPEPRDVEARSPGSASLSPVWVARSHGQAQNLEGEAYLFGPPR